VSSWWKSTQYSDNVFDKLRLCSIGRQLHKTSLISETQFGFLARSLWVLRSVTQREKFLFFHSVRNVSAYLWIPRGTRTSSFRSPTSHCDSTNDTCSSHITPFPSFWTYFGLRLAEHRTLSQYSKYTGCLRRNSKYFRTW